MSVVALWSAAVSGSDVCRKACRPSLEMLPKSAGVLALPPTESSCSVGALALAADANAKPHRAMVQHRSKRAIPEQRLQAGDAGARDEVRPEAVLSTGARSRARQAL